MYQVVEHGWWISFFMVFFPSFLVLLGIVTLAIAQYKKSRRWLIMSIISLALAGVIFGFAAWVGRLM